MSALQLQEQLHIANTRLQEQADRIKQLQADLAVRPLDPHQRCLELQTQVDQLTEMNSKRCMLSRWSTWTGAHPPITRTEEYEKNLLDPGQKVREDVEAEWLPKVQALEARAKEKELFYKELFDDVHRLKSENVKLKEVNLKQ
jgi:centromeric protein E